MSTVRGTLSGHAGRALAAAGGGEGHRWAVLGILMTGTFMAILDTSIVNVALPHMMSAFGVTRDKIEWVSTAFMIASAAVMPMMGWLMSRVNYKTLYLSCLFLFTAASAGCALAWSFESLVLMRVLQALGGGAIIPMGMAIVADLFDEHERGKALGIWGTAIMLGPAIGPTLGGWLTDVSTWRSIFSVNLPVGVMALMAGLIIMKGKKIGNRPGMFDFAGFGFLSLGLVTALVGLSNGQDKGWDSNYIRTCFSLATVGFVMFVGVELYVKHPLIDLRLFLVRNFTMSLVLAVFRSVGLFGSVFLLPLFLQNLAGYTTIQAGLWLMPAAIMVGITMPIGGYLADRYPPAILVATGSSIVGVSLLFFGKLDPMSSWQMIVIPQLFRGVGLALMMAPLIAAALNSVPRAQVPTVSSFMNVAQNVGGAFGIAFLNNYVTNSIQRNAVTLGSGMPMQGEAYVRLGGHVSGIVVRHAPGIWVNPQVKTGFAAAETLMQRAAVIGFDHGFVLSGIVVCAAVPLCFFLKSMPHHRTGPIAVE